MFWGGRSSNGEVDDGGNRLRTARLRHVAQTHQKWGSRAVPYLQHVVDHHSAHYYISCSLTIQSVTWSLSISHSSSTSARGKVIQFRFLQVLRRPIFQPAFSNTIPSEIERSYYFEAVAQTFDADQDRSSSIPSAPKRSACALMSKSSESLVSTGL
jgi:hypothetical protein